MPFFYGPTFSSPSAATPFNGVSTAVRLYGNFTLVAMVFNLTGTAPTTVQFQTGTSNAGPWTNAGAALTFTANNSVVAGKVEVRVYATWLRAIVTNPNGDLIAGQGFFVEGPVTWVP